MEKIIVFDVSFTLFLLHLPCLVTVFVGLGISVYWFGPIANTKCSFSTTLMLEKILISYIITLTSIVVFAINSFVIGGDFGNFISNDIFWLGMGIAVVGFVFTTIFVIAKCVLFWSAAYGLGQRRCRWYLAFYYFGYVAFWSKRLCLF
ncbi:hypothetical protein [Sphingobacterium sp. HMA12]|uniref:hypothetical protein n=1 Tax=Sphingobacterium sp. HMA12 TaxID=2050894 RepID=UPI0013159E54|nr:hypothetical protein [Sphingobacterium sp. HMA12]